MRTILFIASAFALVALVACDRSDPLSENPASAQGETPVRYILCTSVNEGCFVAARFADFAACERHKQLNPLVCNFEGNPKQVACVNPDPPPAYCTK